MAKLEESYQLKREAKQGLNTKTMKKQNRPYIIYVDFLKDGRVIEVEEFPSRDMPYKVQLTLNSGDIEYLMSSKDKDTAEGFLRGFVKGFNYK